MYGLIHNEKIQVGPRSWNYAFFKEYLDDNSLSASTLPLNEPRVSIYGDGWKILRVTEMNVPQIDQTFEMNVGPFWTIHEDRITGSYTKKDKTVDQVKGGLKAIVAANRYAAEVKDISFTFGDGQVVVLFTNREDRDIYLNTYIIMGDEETVSFKFKHGTFRQGVSKSELSEIVALLRSQVKAAFEWETEKAIEIDSYDNIIDLKLVETRHPTQIEE